jgi:hypothetical protein
MYEGYWESGLRSGEGILVTASGKAYRQYWKKEEQSDGLINKGPTTNEIQLPAKIFEEQQKVFKKRKIEVVEDESKRQKTDDDQEK